MLSTWTRTVASYPKVVVPTNRRSRAQIRRRISKRLRVLFFLHAFVLVVCLVAGMSEVYPYLAWGQFLMPVAALLSPANIALPIVIFVRGRAEEVPTAALVFAVFLSVLMTIAIVLCHAAAG